MGNANTSPSLSSSASPAAATDFSYTGSALGAGAFPSGHSDNTTSADSIRAAAFDIGSNSVKTLIGEASPGNTLAWRVIAEESIGTRLAEDLIHCGELKPAAMERTFTALERLSTLATQHGVTRRAAVATSAVRDSTNRKVFLKRAQEVLGCTVRLLSGDEEAETTFQGVASDPFWHPRGIFVTEVGGGSAQWIQGNAQGIQQKMSLPMGAVRLRERFISGHPVGQEGLQKLLAALHGQLQPALAYYTLGERLFVGTGGTATTLAAIDQSMNQYDPARVDHYRLSRHELAARLEYLAGLTLDELTNHVPGLPPKRADLMVPGGAVLYVTMEIIGAHELVASVRGLRYGLMRQLLDQPPLRDTGPAA